MNDKHRILAELCGTMELGFCNIWTFCVAPHDTGTLQTYYDDTLKQCYGFRSFWLFRIR